MEISKFKFAVVLLLCIICSSALIYFFTRFPSITTKHKSNELKTNVFMIIEKYDYHATLEIGNVITNIGEQYIRNVLGFNNITSFNATKWISLGNASATQTLTKLTQELTTANGVRALATATAHYLSGDYATNFTKKFTFTGTCRFNATGLQWNSTPDSDGNLFAVANIEELTWNNNENCTIIWSVIHDAN